MAARSSTTDYLVPPRPPVGAMVLAAVICLAGAVMLVVSLSLKWHPVVAVLFGVLMVAGFALGLLAFLSMGRLSVRFELNPDGYLLRGPQGEQQGSWTDVTRVTRAGDVVTIHRGPDQRDRLVFTSADEELVVEMLDDMAQRLDAAKGYTSVPWD